MDFFLTFVTGILGSMHCVGMCGAIVMAYSTQQGSPKVDGTLTVGSSLRSGFPAHLVYNSGRIVSYMVVGALAGFFGGIIFSVKEVGMWFSIVAGTLMVVTGLLMLNLVPRINVWSGGDKSWLRRLHLQSVANLLTLRTLESKFYIGLLTPFLPCGLLYSMFIKAAATGGGISGALTMLAFGAGIVPALVLTGLVSAYVGIKLRYYANKLAAVTIILMGLIMIMRGTGAPIPFTGSHHGEHMRVDPGSEQMRHQR
jgi:uncharacterized protein